jgi:hypothetical protein
VSKTAICYAPLVGRFGDFHRVKVGYVAARAPSEVENRIRMGGIRITQDLQPNPTGKGSITEETVHGAVTVRYSEGKPAMVNAWSKAQSIIQPLLARGGLFLVRS